MKRLRGTRLLLLALPGLLWFSGCSTLNPDAHLAAFSTQLTGMNQVPPTPSLAGGKLYAVLDRNTRLLRWKLDYSGLSGVATAGHFHGPAAIGANAPALLSLGTQLRSPQEGRATLTPAQAADLLAGRWYVSLRTAAYPAGEIRGQLILRE